MRRASGVGPPGFTCLANQVAKICAKCDAKFRGESLAKSFSAFSAFGAFGRVCIVSAVVSVAVGLLCGVAVAVADEPEFDAKLRIALASNREHYWYPRIVLYDHDGVSRGKVAKVYSSPDKRLDHQPALAARSKLGVFGWEAEGGVGRLRLFDFEKATAVEAPTLDKMPNTLFSPSLSADGRWLAFTGWALPGASPRWDVALLDTETKQLVELPGLNSVEFDERRVAISGDGQTLAYTTNARDGSGLTDIRIYHRPTKTLDLLKEANSDAGENYPSLNQDGTLVAFTSDRDAGEGGQDVYVFDRGARRLVPLPGLNSPGQEQSPSLSGSGRYVAFVSERFDGAGEQDIYLYDRAAAKLLPTPGLNTNRDDFDPVVVEK